MIWWSLGWEDPTCLGATKSMLHNYWACALQQEKPLQWEARALPLESGPCLPQTEKSPTSKEDPAQPSINKYIIFKRAQAYSFFRMSLDWSSLHFFPLMHTWSDHHRCDIGPSQCFVSKAQDVYLTHCWWCPFGLLVKMVSARFLHSKLLLFNRPDL